MHWEARTVLRESDTPTPLISTDGQRFASPGLPSVTHQHPRIPENSIIPDGRGGVHDFDILYIYWLGIAQGESTGVVAEQKFCSSGSGIVQMI